MFVNFIILNCEISQKIMSAQYFSRIPDMVTFIYLLIYLLIHLFIYYLCEKKKYVIRFCYVNLNGKK